MKWLLRLAWIYYGKQLQNEFVRKAKRKGLAAYLRLVQGGRYFLVAILCAFLMLQTMMLAAFGALVTGFLLWDFDKQSKLQILLGLFLTLFFVPLALLIWGLSERTWFRASGAAKLMQDLNRDEP